VLSLQGEKHCLFLFAVAAIQILHELVLSVIIPIIEIGGGESGGNALKAKLVDLSYLRASFMERLVFSQWGR
jgi:hypothetical protein